MKYQALLVGALLLVFGLGSGCVKKEVVKKTTLQELTEEYETLEKAEANALTLYEGTVEAKESKKAALAEAKKAEAKRLKAQAEKYEEAADKLVEDAEKLQPVEIEEVPAETKPTMDPSLYLDIKVVDFTEDGYEVLTVEEDWPTGWKVFFKNSKSYFLFVHTEKGKWHFTAPKGFTGPTCYRFHPEADPGKRVTLCP